MGSPGWLVAAMDAVNVTDAPHAKQGTAMFMSLLSRILRWLRPRPPLPPVPRVPQPRCPLCGQWIPAEGYHGCPRGLRV